MFLAGTHVDLTQKATQCLSDFSVDFERANSFVNGVVPGPNMTVSSVTINGQPATFEFKRPTFPGNPNGPTRRPRYRWRTPPATTIPISATNPNPPACAPIGNAAANQGLPCPANKLVITPSAPIAAGTEYKVTINYTGRPGVHQDGDGSQRGLVPQQQPGR